MNYYERIQFSIDYIEQHIKDHLEIIVISQKAFMLLSIYYRLFFSFIGYTVKEYIRNRRITLAALEIKTSNRRLLDIALDYDFENGDTFTRAFKKTVSCNSR